MSRGRRTELYFLQLMTFMLFPYFVKKGSCFINAMRSCECVGCAFNGTLGEQNKIPGAGSVSIKRVMFKTILV